MATDLARREQAPVAPMFAAYESAGRWDRDLRLLKPSVDRLQRARIAGVKVSAGMHTEMSRDELESAFQHQPGNWGHVRLDKSTAAEMVATIDRDHWHFVKARALVMSKVEIHTEKGHPLPRPTMLEVVLDSTDPDARGTGVLHLGDLNLDMRTAERDLVLRLCAQVPGFHQSWNLRDLPAHGTHVRALIDNGLTDLLIRFGGARLLRDDNSSDHRPFGCVYGTPARLYLQGMHWPLQNTDKRILASKEVRERMAARWLRIHDAGHHAPTLPRLVDTAEAVDAWDLPLAA